MEKEATALEGQPTASSAGVSIMTRWLTLWLGAIATFFGAGEFAARIDDRLFSDVPVMANPVREIDLMVQEAWGARGRPNGHFRKWRLNKDGFLGPDISASTSATRLMVLGASETFGLYESPGRDYPAQLRAEFTGRGITDVEVINAGLAGMALPSMAAYWKGWASHFSPNLVLIYPSAHFYLNTEPPSERPPQAMPLQQSSRPLRLRFMDRIADHLKQVPLFRRVRAFLVVRSELSGKGDDYLFTAAPPEDRLLRFTADLERLGEAIVRSGSTPVLMTHAFKMPLALSAADRAELEYFRIFLPRAKVEAMPAFEDAARQATLRLGARHGWQVIDVAGHLSGHRELFADPVHFTNEGSRRMASLIADEISAALVGARRTH